MVCSLKKKKRDYFQSNLTPHSSKVPLQKVIMSYPRIEFRKNYSLKIPLARLRIKTAFTPDADFSKIVPRNSGSKPIFISDAIHQAYVNVNEEGTKASAATGVKMRVTSSASHKKIPVFRADHPFVFLIQDNRHGGIFILGRMTDPRDGS